MPVFQNDNVRIAYDVVGNGPPVLMLHGFPQCRAMWADIATDLSKANTLVMADLRGYGASSKPDLSDISNYTFRAMGEDQTALMEHLGFPKFHLVGHDRGARVAYRMALDAPDAILSLALMDIVPTHHLVTNWNSAVAKAYYHWTFLAQPSPFPETMIGADPDHFYEACLLGWGGAKISDFAQIETYRAAWRDPDTIAGTTNDYRAGFTLDVDHDAQDIGRKIACPTLVLFGADGVMAKLYDIHSTWAPWLSDMRTEAIPGGHFFVDQSPNETAASLKRHLGS